MKSTKRMLLLSTISLVLCFAMLIGTTWAWFTDEVVSGKNQIIAGNLDVEPETVEEIVVQIIIDTENSYAGETNNGEDAAVLGVRRSEETVGVEEQEAETIETVMSIAKEMAVENTLDAAQEISIIEDEEVALANFNEEFGYGRNLWLPFIIAFVCAAVIMFIVVKRKQEEN